MTANAARFSPEPARSLVVVVASVQVPIRSHTAPMALVITIQSAKAIEVHADAPVTTPRPSIPTMQTMVVVVTTIQTPVSTNDNPLSSSPSFQHAHAIQMAADAACATPEPTSWPVIMVAPPQMPIGTHATPVTLIITVQCAMTIQMHTKPTESTPDPSSAAMITVIESVFAPQMPVRPHLVPAGPIPTLQDAQSILVPANAAIMV